MLEKLVLETWVDAQLAAHRGMNLFSARALDSFRFSQGMSSTLGMFLEMGDHDVACLIEQTANKTIAEFCRVNQYFGIDWQTRQNLKAAYTTLLGEIRNGKKDEFGVVIENIARRHFTRLRQVLRQSNPFAETLYADQPSVLRPVPCCDYSAALQMDILEIDLHDLAEPVLDIGCGKDANLVKFLRLQGMEAFGVDRFAESVPFLTRASWFEFDFKPGRWGTILSHLGFSNHFQHHHHRRDGNFVQYTQAYLQILASLKIGGHFHYAPGLEFVERHLDPGRFVVRRKHLENGFDSTVIEKVS